MRRFVTVAFAAGLALVSVALAAQQEGGGQSGTGTMRAPEAKAPTAMEIYAKAAEPGPNHRWLAAMEGTWEVEVTAWMDPKGEPSLSKGKAVMTMVLGGRFLEQRFESIFMEAPFRGIGYSAYDNVRRVFTGVWMDTMTTQFLTEEGNLDATGKVLTTVMTSSDPITGKTKRGRSILTVVDKDTHTVVMYDQGPDGKEFKAMEMTYRRVKKVK